MVKTMVKTIRKKRKEPPPYTKKKRAAINDLKKTGHAHARCVTGRAQSWWTDAGGGALWGRGVRRSLPGVESLLPPLAAASRVFFFIYLCQATYCIVTVYLYCGALKLFCVRVNVVGGHRAIAGRDILICVA